LKKLMVSLAAVLAFGAAAGGANAQKAGDPREGLVLAQQVCARCHATVADEIRSPNAKAPRFADLASTPGMTGTALMVALTTPHADMPMFTFTSEQRDDIVAYILSLH